MRSYQQIILFYIERRPKVIESEISQTLNLSRID